MCYTRTLKMNSYFLFIFEAHTSQAKRNFCNDKQQLLFVSCIVQYVAIRINFYCVGQGVFIPYDLTPFLKKVTNSNGYRSIKI